MINCENSAETFASGQIDQSRVRKIHWPIPIAGHQSLDFGQLRILDHCQPEGAGTDKLPLDLSLMTVLVHQMEEWVNTASEVRRGNLS